ncbi:MAG: aminoglycoside 6-adenylyltransferase [Armatimonadetes bacterium]|nr:aminoglycoside 6-adenylyltransferase [Armatimonadota bacterium]
MPLTEHHQFVGRAVSLFRADSRFVGAGVGGSWLTNTMDRFSDVDLVIVVEPESFCEVISERTAIATKLGSCLAAFTGEHVGEPRLLICLYDSPLLHVDLKFVTLPDLTHRVEDPVVLWEREGRMSQVIAASMAHYPPLDPQWIEDRFWVWAHYVALKIGRGELFEAISMLDYLRQTAIAPFLHTRHGQSPRGVRHLERVAPEAVPYLVQSLATHTPLSCADALLCVIKLYRDLREPLVGDDTITKRTDAETAVMLYVHEIRTASENNNL